MEQRFTKETPRSCHFLAIRLSLSVLLSHPQFLIQRAAEAEMEEGGRSLQGAGRLLVDFTLFPDRSRCAQSILKFQKPQTDRSPGPISSICGRLPQKKSESAFVFLCVHFFPSFPFFLFISFFFFISFFIFSSFLLQQETQSFKNQTKSNFQNNKQTNKQKNVV